MSKTKEVAHHYLGSKCKIVRTDSELIYKLNSIEDIKPSLLMFYDYGNIDIRLQLIPLEEMTMEHKRGLYFADGIVRDDVIYTDYTYDNYYLKITSKKQYKPTELAWLLAHSYDVFNLIPAGEADNLSTQNHISETF